jgi:hypothetical protein
MNRILTWFAGKDRKNDDRRRPARPPLVESLEGRQLLSWTTVPSKFSWPSSVGVSFNSNARAGTATISQNEVDVYNFVAPRSGTFTFNAGKFGSQIDTIAGLFKFNGARIVGNDDSNGTRDSSFTASLIGGTKYAFAITNYTGHSNGGYRWSISGPPMFNNLNHNAGSGITSYASASLSGNSLSIFLSGLNSSNFKSYTHKVSVSFVNASNRPITGAWELSFGTVGKLRPGKSADTMTRVFDVSGFDLRAARDIRLVLS